MNEPACEQALQLGREQENVTALRVVERLHPEPVADDDSPPAAPVPDGDGEHPAQALDERVSVGLVEVRENLRVAARGKSVAVRAELVAKRLVVEDLTVLHRPDLTGLVGERLVAGDDVDDAEASRAQRGPVGQVCAAVVRTTVRHRIGHCIQDRLRERRTRLVAHDERAGDSTHPAHRSRRFRIDRRPFAQRRPPGRIVLGRRLQLRA